MNNTNVSNSDFNPFHHNYKVAQNELHISGYLLMYHIYLSYDPDSSINSVLTLKAYNYLCCLFYQCAMLSSPIITEKEWAVLAKMDQISNITKNDLESNKQIKLEQIHICRLTLGNSVARSQSKLDFISYIPYML